MQNNRFRPLPLAAGILLAVTAALNCVGGFLLPPQFSSGTSRVPTLSFLVGGILLVGVCGMMAVFGPKPKKWMILESVLAFADAAMLVYNLFLLYKRTKT